MAWISLGQSQFCQMGTALERKRAQNFPVGNRRLQPRRTLACDLYLRLDSAFVHNQQVIFYFFG